ncbi:DUF6531 domain-containing protein, partial [Lampropedia aestuarii]|uniref:DUF6531 domain-containing protein n=1 Tax=Lampropedia aestuarii TaxID=2562762 RepID=UPI00246891C1
MAGRPINTAYGCKVLSGPQELDFDLPAPLPLPWQRTYVSKNPSIGWLGQGWSTPFALQLQRTKDGLLLIDEQGRRIPLPEVPPGESHYSRFEQFSLERSESGTAYTLVFNNGQLRMHLQPIGLGPNASIYQRATAPIYTLHALEDANGNRIQLHYGPWPNNLQPGDFDLEDAPALLVPNGLTDSAGRQLRLEFQALGSPTEPCLPGHDRGLRLVRIVQTSDAQAPTGPTPTPLAEGPRTLVRYHYSDQGDLIAVHNMLGHTVREFGWRNHIMVMHRDAAGLVSEYEYDRYEPSGQVLRNWSNDGQQWQLHYSSGATTVTHSGAGGQLASRKTWFHDAERHYTGHQDELGGQLQRELDAFGNLLAVTDEAGRTTRYQLDLQGRPTHISLADGTHTTIAYDTASGQVASLTTADGATTYYQYDARGNLHSLTDALGHTTHYTHDSRGLPTTITDALGKTKHLAYNAAGQLIHYTDCSGQSTRYHYNDWGHLASITDALEQTTHYTHDAAGRLLQVRHPDGSIEQMHYDSAGRMLAYIDPLGAHTEYTLAIDGLPTLRRNAQGGELRYEYDALRRLSTLINENNARYDFGYDALSRLSHETGFDGRHTRYQYDPTALLLHKLEQGTLSPQAREQLLQNTQPPLTTQHIPPTLEDPWGLRTLESPDYSAEPLPGAAIETRYERDAMGRLIHKQVSGHVLGGQANEPPNGRDTSPSAAPSTPGTLQPQVRSTRYTYDAMGRLLHAANDSGSRTHLAYDLLGQLRQEERIGQGLHSLLQHRYDALGNRIQTSLPDGRNIHWLHYGAGHLHQIHVDGHLICDFERDALHREVLRTQGALTSRYGHDALGRLVQQATWRSPTAQGQRAPQTGHGADHQTPTPSWAWEPLGDTRHQPQAATVISRADHYDRAGNLLSQQDKRHGHTHYHYDRIGRLLSASQPQLSEHFAFDPAHNMQPASEATTPTAQASGGLVRHNRIEVFEDKRYRYDTHGNLIEKRIGKHTHIRLIWDVEHQLQAAIVTRSGNTDVPSTQRFDYQYDAFGRRIAKTDAFGHTLFAWDGNRLLSEQRGSRTTLYLYEPNSFAPLAQLVDGQDQEEKTPHATTAAANDATEDED